MDNMNIQDDEQVSPLEIEYSELLGEPVADPHEDYGSNATDSLLEEAINALSSGDDSNDAQTVEQSQAQTDNQNAVNTQHSAETDTQNTLRIPGENQDIRQLLSEVQRKLQESELLEYARRQGDMIEKEVRQLSVAGIRVTQDEVQQVVKEAFEKGIEPYVYFKSYAAELMKNYLIFGNAKPNTPVRTNRPPGVNQPSPPVRPSQPVQRTESGMIPIDYFLAEELENE
ncbi:MAG: hypothetical protein KatS3mg087_0512 [Patescibacteria group bacterium]|nr:MAG: hypothetical protein KatS3mg087_0512 [Patescibacteria group bacterium]